MGVYETREQAEVWAHLYPYQTVVVENLQSHPLDLSYLATLLKNN